MNTTLNPDVLRWARNKAGLTEDALADKVGVQSGLVKEWEKTGSIRFDLVEKLAEKTRIAFGFLFLSEPPTPTLPIADFRRVNDGFHSTASDDLLEVIYSAQLKQDWYREYMISQNENPLPFVGKSTLKTPVRDTAEDIRSTLGIGPELAAQTTKWEETIRYTTEAAEDHGILVLRTGCVAGVTSRGLNVDEFRGFALSDKHAPLIFVNGADALAAQIFTLAHEIAHIWVGETGVSNLEKTYTRASELEKYCNSVAAEVLLPLVEIKASWQGEINDTAEIDRLAYKYKTSRIVVARRARDADLLTEEEFNSYYGLVVANVQKSKGGDYYINEKYQNSQRFSVAIVKEALAGRETQREAMQLLGIKKDTTFRKYVHSLQQEGLEWPI